MSYYNTVNFSQLADVAAFVILRGQCGTAIDTKFTEYAAACQKYGIPFGVYCYSKAMTAAEAEEEAQLFWDNTHAYHPKFYCMDAEKEFCTAEIIAAFAEEMRACGVKKLGCYVAHEKYAKYEFDTVRGRFDFVWIPRYGSNDGNIPNVKPNYACDLWQYTSTGSCKGVTGNCDLNVITGTGKSLSWFIS